MELNFTKKDWTILPNYADIYIITLKQTLVKSSSNFTQFGITADPRLIFFYNNTFCFCVLSCTSNQVSNGLMSKLKNGIWVQCDSVNKEKDFPREKMFNQYRQIKANKKLCNLGLNISRLVYNEFEWLNT
jgi:hypothetical protein